ncbi:MAG: hypothetical protein AB7G93_19905 [Bdellovibrionales bacterium]
MGTESNRRNFLKIGTGAATAAFLLSPVAKAVAAACGTTPPQTSGPFYPGEDRFHTDTDLTRVPGHAVRAEGQVVYIKGKVVDADCNPIVNANVEIWQACATGKYNNPRDPNPAPLDPHFKYWAETYTDANGEYGFKTIIPGAYPADTGWTRPPHIHFKVTRLGFRELVTQMYFRGNALNEEDLILQGIPAAERDAVIVNFQPAPADMEPGSLIGEFDITLQSVR